MIELLTVISVNAYVPDCRFIQIEGTLGGQQHPLITLRGGVEVGDVCLMPEVKAVTNQMMAQVAVDVVLSAVAVHVCTGLEQAHDVTHWRHSFILSSFVVHDTPPCTGHPYFRWKVGQTRCWNQSVNNVP